MRLPGLLARDHWVRRIDALDPDTDFEEIARITGHHEFPWDVQQALATTVYNAGGCQSYFLDVNGRNSFNWPWSTGRMVQRLNEFDQRAYEVSTR